MDGVERNYRRKTKTSAKIFSRSERLHVNGVHHNIRFFEPYPFVVESAKGKHLVDVDSNKYVDFWMGHWSLILGHAPKPVSGAARAQLRKGWMFGTVNKNTVDLSERIAKAVPVAEKIRYVTTGTEATMYAVRLARAFTGRSVVAKIDGGWHGYTTDLLKTVNWPFNQPEGRGLTDEKHIVSIPYNNLEGSLQVLQRVGKNLAAVIIEPVLGGGGCIPATWDYLKGIQDFVKKNGSLFILDEIVTGFRFHYGCLYDVMNLDPDIVTLGKIIGGGFPIGAICGKKEILQLADTTRYEKTKRAYVGGGTFSANPMTMIAGSATLEALKDKGATYEKIRKLGEKTRKQVAGAFDGNVIVTGKDSLFMTHFTAGKVSKIDSASDVAMCDSSLLQRFHFEMIANHGIFFLPGKLGAFSAAHSDSDVRDITAAAESFAQKI